MYRFSYGFENRYFYQKMLWEMYGTIPQHKGIVLIFVASFRKLLVHLNRPYAS